MPELTLISVPISIVKAAQKAGTVDATFLPLWDGIETSCFLCDAALPASAGRPTIVRLDPRRGEVLIQPHDASAVGARSR